MKKFIFLTVLIITTTKAFATAQVREILFYKGEKYYMCTTPLESYFLEGNSRLKIGRRCTGCWRGYIGTWEIKNNFLYLASLTEGCPHGKEIPLTEIFDKKSGPVKAEWYSGVIYIPQGKRILYIDMGFGSIYGANYGQQRERPSYINMGFESIYESGIYITIKKGKIIFEWDVDAEVSAARSILDLKWVSLGLGAANDDKNWYDARLVSMPDFIEIRKSGTKFITRGILIENSRGNPALGIPDTPSTKMCSIDLHSLPENNIIKGSHIEIKANFTYKDRNYFLQVDSIRRLNPGETIHHPNFLSHNKEE